MNFSDENREVLEQLSDALIGALNHEPDSLPQIMSPFDPPVIVMDSYNCEQIIVPDLTYSDTSYGTMHRVKQSENVFKTALHVTIIEQGPLRSFVQELEIKYGKCIQIAGTDLHIFGDLTNFKMPVVPEMFEGKELTIVGIPAGSTFPEIFHCNYLIPQDGQENSHWVTSDKRLFGGVSGGAVYEGHLRHSELIDAISIGHVRAQGDIRGEGYKIDHFAVVSFNEDIV